MRILYLFPKSLYDTKMSVGRVLYGEAVARQPDIELRFWGEGWPGYDNDLTVQQNVDRSGERYDAVWYYKADRLKGAAFINGLRLLCFNEANDPKLVMREVEACDADLVVFHHDSDLRRWNGLRAEGYRLVHLLHGADATFFRQREKTNPCILTGVSSPEVYPLRERFRRFVSEGRIPGTIRRHPGYRLRTHVECRGQYQDYADELGTAKISLCCTSRYRYPLQKIVESMLAGCAVVTDMPDDSVFADTLGRHVIPVDSDADDASICATVRGWLYRPDELAGKAESGRQCVMNNFTTDHYARSLVRAIKESL